MKAKNYIYILAFILCSPIALNAQKVGYMGKRFMIKLNIVNGVRPQYYGGELEYALHRKISLGVGGGYQTGEYKQLYYTQYQYSSYALYYKKHLSSKNTTINAYSFYGQLKWFAFNRLKSAPDGFYFGLKAGGGFADVDNRSGYPVRINIYPSATYVPKSFHIKAVPFSFYEFGPGFQKIFWGRFVIDASAYLNITTFNATGSATSQEYTATLARQFGPNTAWLGPTLTDNTAPNGHVNASDVHPRTFTSDFGVSLYFKVGVLLF